MNEDTGSLSLSGPFHGSFEGKGRADPSRRYILGGDEPIETNFSASLFRMKEELPKVEMAPKSPRSASPRWDHSDALFDPNHQVRMDVVEESHGARQGVGETYPPPTRKQLSDFEELDDLPDNGGGADAPQTDDDIRAYEKEVYVSDAPHPDMEMQHHVGDVQASEDQSMGSPYVKLQPPASPSRLLRPKQVARRLKSSKLQMKAHKKDACVKVPRGQPLRRNNGNQKKKRKATVRPPLVPYWRLRDREAITSFPETLLTILRCHANLPVFVFPHDPQGRFEFVYGGKTYSAVFSLATKQIDVISAENTALFDKPLDLRSINRGPIKPNSDIMQISSCPKPLANGKGLNVQPSWIGQGLSQGHTNKVVLMVNLASGRQLCWLISLRTSKDLMKGEKSGLSYKFQIGHDPQTAEYLEIEMKSVKVTGNLAKMSFSSSFATKCSERIQQNSNEFIGAAIPYHPVTSKSCIVSCITARCTDIITSLEICPYQQKCKSQPISDAKAWGIIYQRINVLQGVAPRVAPVRVDPAIPPITIPSSFNDQTTSRHLPHSEDQSATTISTSNRVQFSTELMST